MVMVYVLVLRLVILMMCWFCAFGYKPDDWYNKTQLFKSFG